MLAPLPKARTMPPLVAHKIVDLYRCYPALLDPVSTSNLCCPSQKETSTQADRTRTPVVLDHYMRAEIEFHQLTDLADFFAA